jgi:hypothetical protein
MVTVSWELLITAVATLTNPHFVMTNRPHQGRH